ncbi:MAG: hypothetical protein AAFY72_11040 [Cyanobacteria bacterium J06649_4]
MNYLQRARSRVHRSPRRSYSLSPIQHWLAAIFSMLSARWSCAHHPWIAHFSHWKTVGVCLGVLLFCGIITHADPASAQLFKTVESQVTTIFGSNIDSSISNYSG